MKRKIGWMILSFTLVFITTSFGQYSAETVLEKSFEQMDFFFTPDHLNPYGLNGFVDVTPGLMDEPLLNLSINPANLYADSARHHYLYLDLRNQVRVFEDHYGIHPLYEYRNYSLYFPTYFIESRRALEPAITMALLSRPMNNGFVLGATYKAMIQDEGYYAIPYDVYRSSVGYDYAGSKMAESSNIPIIDVYSGQDRMHQIGHFINFYGGYELTPKLKFGIKLGRVIFDRDGSFGSKNFWESTYSRDNTSLWYNLENRSQDYQHWEYSGGVKLLVTDRMALGASIGYLQGDVIQTMAQEDSSFYLYGNKYNDDYWSFYHKFGDADKNWAHDGRTFMGGVDFTYRINRDKVLNLIYQYQQQQVDMSLRSTLEDTSFSEYQNTWNGSYYYGDSDYRLFDVRDGSGENRVKIHRFMGALQWQLEQNKLLHIGLRLELSKRNTHTLENVFSDRQMRYHQESSQNENDYDYWNAVVEDKRLSWDFGAKMTSIQVPIIFKWRVSRIAELLIGVNRKMVSWNIDDVTLALFNYRVLTVDSTTERKENFGERYTQPQEKRNDVQTMVMLGLTTTPSKFFEVRLLLVPNFTDAFDGRRLSDITWWIGVNLYP